MNNHVSSPIPHIPIDDDVKASYLAAMVKGNVILCHYAERVFGGSVIELRSRLFYPRDRPDRMSPRDIGMTAEEFAAVKAVRDLEVPMLQGHIKLITRLANRLANRCHGVVDGNDLIMVGAEAMIDAVWGYNRSTVKFLTYAHTTVFRRMIRTLNTANNFSKISQDKERLLASYYKALVRAPEDASFDSVVARMKVKDGKDDKVGHPPTDCEIDILRTVFVHFARDSEMTGDDGDGGIESIEDSMGGIDFDSISLNEAIQSADLTLAELELIEIAQTGRRGQKAAWAKKHGVSRQYVKKALIKATSKVNSVRRQVQGAA